VGEWGREPPVEEPSDTAQELAQVLAGAMSGEEAPLGLIAARELAGASNVSALAPHLEWGGGGLPGSAGVGLPAERLASLVRSVQEFVFAPAAEEPAPVTVERAGRAERLLRFIVVVVLVAGVLAAVIRPDLVSALLPSVGLPAGYPRGPARMHDTLRLVGSNDRVMLAFEYGPLEADELDLVAAPLIRQLAEQGARMTLVSTRADGLVAGRALLRQAFVEADGLGFSDLSDVQRTIESGAYRPGGAVGVAHLLQSFAVPDVVVIFAARPGRLRRWVEQVQVLDGPPVVVAGTSASAEGPAIALLSSEPALLGGVVSGVSGAAYYERISSGGVAGGAAFERLAAIAAGNLAVVVLVILGAATVGWAGSDARARRQRGR
jgi:hypothetical protein